MYQVCSNKLKNMFTPNYTAYNKQFLSSHD